MENFIILYIALLLLNMVPFVIILEDINYSVNTKTKLIWFFVPFSIIFSFILKENKRKKIKHYKNIDKILNKFINKETI